jgi:hypothetical protein
MGNMGQTMTTLTAYEAALALERLDNASAYTASLHATLGHAADNDTTTHVLILRRMLARAVRREQRFRKEFFG